MAKKKIKRSPQAFDAQVVIEKGIPIPKDRTRGIQFPFDKMEVGDSFYQESVTMNSVRVKAIAYAKENLNPDGQMPVFVHVNERSGTRTFRTR